jgi:hypothetical protein
MLSTLGSIPADTELDEQDIVEMDDLHVGLGLRASMGTRPDTGDDEDEDETTPAPAYEVLEMGFRTRGPSLEGDLTRIRVDVERTTSTI